MTKAIRVLNYYGSKVRSAKHYPPPLHDTIIEPFAGGAGYSLLHRTKNVVLYDANPDVIAAWSYLIGTASDDILRLPLLAPGEAVPLDLPYGARMLIGFNCMLIGARAHRSMVPCAAKVPASFWGAAKRAVLADLADEIRHWRAETRHYADIDMQEAATWFIDPPYIGKLGDPYRIDVRYEELAGWCKGRTGQVIVCEAPGATWLPFVESHTVRAAPRPGLEGRPVARESIWYRAA